MLLLWLAVMLLLRLAVIIFAGHGKNARVEREMVKTRRKVQKRTYNVNDHSSHRASPKTAC